MRLYLVDAFTPRPFGGNPAAVTVLERDLTDVQMHLIAREMNLSETAFLRQRGGAGRYQLRWFTPTSEVPLCGHATLASAKVLWERADARSNPLEFDTLSGVLKAHRTPEAIALDFPAEETEPCSVSPEFLQALGLTEAEDVRRGPTSRKILVRLRSRDAVRSLRVRPEMLRDVAPDGSVKGVIVTAPGAPPYDFVSRFFAPWLGVDEDPVTGSAHTVLGPYWGERLGKREMFARQDSERGGELSVRLDRPGRVTLLGQAQIIGQVDLEVPPPTDP